MFCPISNPYNCDFPSSFGVIFRIQKMIKMCYHSTLPSLMGSDGNQGSYEKTSKTWQQK